MDRLLILLILLFSACTPNGVESDDARRILINPVRLEIYLYEFDNENECAQYLENPDLRTHKKPILLRQSWADLDSQSFATLQIDHLNSSKKLLLFVTAIDPSTNNPIGYGCLQDVEIEKGVLREVDLVLHKVASHQEAT